MALRVLEAFFYFLLKDPVFLERLQQEVITHSSQMWFLSLKHEDCPISKR